MMGHPGCPFAGLPKKTLVADLPSVSGRVVSNPRPVIASARSGGQGGKPAMKPENLKVNYDPENLLGTPKTGHIARRMQEKMMQKDSQVKHPPHKGASFRTSHSKSHKGPLQLAPFERGPIIHPSAIPPAFINHNGADYLKLKRLCRLVAVLLPRIRLVMKCCQTPAWWSS